MRADNLVRRGEDEEDEEERMWMRIGEDEDEDGIIKGQERCSLSQVCPVKCALSFTVCRHNPANLKMQSRAQRTSVSCHHRPPFQTNFITHRGQGRAVWLRVGPRALRRAFLISVIPAEDYNANPWDKSLLVTGRPSAVAVNQRGLLNYSFPVYSRRQVRDLCDECPGCLGEVVTREGGVGGLAARRDSGGDTAGERGFRGTCQCVRPRWWLQVCGSFCFSCFLILTQRQGRVRFTDFQAKLHARIFLEGEGAAVANFERIG